MDPRKKLLLELKMLDIGIVPNTNHYSNVEKQLKSMDPKDARQAKRKWRKLKRKAMSQSTIQNPKAFHKKFAVLMMLARDQDT